MEKRSFFSTFFGTYFAIPQICLGLSSCCCAISAFGLLVVLIHLEPWHIHAFAHDFLSLLCNAFI